MEMSRQMLYFRRAEKVESHTSLQGKGVGGRKKAPGVLDNGFFKIIKKLTQGRLEELLLYTALCSLSRTFYFCHSMLKTNKQSLLRKGFVETENPLTESGSIINANQGLRISFQTSAAQIIHLSHYVDGVLLLLLKSCPWLPVTFQSPP